MHIFEITDSARRMIQPCKCSDTTLGGERERQVITRGHRDDWVDEVRLSERCRGELGEVLNSSENEQ